MAGRTLSYYLEAFENMNRAVMRGISAPHKPLLLLAILNLVQNHLVTSHHILLSKELVTEFKRLFSQNVAEHLSFMGIPINGTITQFQSKLQGKGCVLNKAISQGLSVGCRAFNGKFAGDKVDIYVYYNETTKNVYRVKAVVSGVSENLADQEYEKIKRMLLTKYGSDFCTYVLKQIRRHLVYS